MSKILIDWDFETLDTTTYKCVLLVPKVSNRLFLNMFQKAAKKINNKGIDLKDSNPDIIESFDIDSRFYNLMSTIINRQMQGIIKEVLQDDIKVLNTNIDKASFIRMQQSKDWKVNIIVKGDYMKV